MRTATFNGNTIRYPDEMSMVFNRNVVTVITTSQEATFTITGYNESYTDTRQAYNNRVQIDISEYMRMLINSDGITVTRLSKEITVDVEIDGNTFSFTTLAIWGAINVGETFNASRKVTFYNIEGMSQALNYYAPQGSNIEIRKDGGQYTQLKAGDNTLSAVILKSLGISESATIRIGGVSSVFDYTFDNTFTPLPDGVVYIDITVDECSDGVILQWVDRQGFLQYQKFILSSEQYKAEAIGDEVEMEATYDAYSIYGVKRWQGKETERSVKACATLVDQETAYRLTSLLSAPVVMMFKDGSWINVRIEDATKNITQEHLQDFEVNIIYPDLISQKL